MRPSAPERPSRHRRPVATAVLLALVVVATLAGCSSSPSSTATTAASTNPTSCDRPLPASPVKATPVAGSTTDWNITSFDGTVIRAHWFPVNSYVPTAGTGPHPTVLMGPGWSLAGDTDTTGQGVLGGLPIKDLLAAGYNVLTWDPRGFGHSGGQAEVDSPEL